MGKRLDERLLHKDLPALRFEATARTSVYRFADDIVVVVRPKDRVSRIDIRSVSRIGLGDRGVNATRIREFTEAFER